MAEVIVAWVADDTVPARLYFKGKLGNTLATA